MHKHSNSGLEGVVKGSVLYFEHKRNCELILRSFVTNKLNNLSATAFRYGYDSNSRLTIRWTPAKGTTTYAYNAVGNLTGVTYPTNSALTLGYDVLNRLSERGSLLWTQV